MSKYRIVSDSSSDLFQFDGADFKSVPLSIIIDGRQFTDDGTTNIQEMEECMDRSQEKTGSSCPNTFQWDDAFEGADNIFAITITSALSGSYNSAVQAAEEFMQTHPTVKIHVIDSLATGPELILIIEKLAELFKEEKSFEEIREEISAYQKHTHLLFALQSLKNLAKNGRINPAIAKILGLLGINIVGKASEEGTLEIIDKCRGAKKAQKLLFEEIEKNGYNGRKIRISHNDNEEGANAIRNMIISKYPFADVSVISCGALDSYYAEKHGMLIGYEDALK